MECLRQGGLELAKIELSKKELSWAEVGTNLLRTNRDVLMAV
jgi:hypothetical protein